MRDRARQIQAATFGDACTRVQIVALLAGAALIAAGQATVAEAGAYVAPFLLISERLAARQGGTTPAQDQPRKPGRPPRP